MYDSDSMVTKADIAAERAVGQTEFMWDGLGGLIGHFEMYGDDMVIVPDAESLERIQEFMEGRG